MRPRARAAPAISLLIGESYDTAFLGARTFNVTRWRFWVRVQIRLGRKMLPGSVQKGAIPPKRTQATKADQGMVRFEIQIALARDTLILARGTQVHPHKL